MFTPCPRALKQIPIFLIIKFDAEYQKTALVLCGINPKIQTILMAITSDKLFSLVRIIDLQMELM